MPPKATKAAPSGILYTLFQVPKQLRPYFTARRSVLAFPAVPDPPSGSLASKIHLCAVLLKEGLKDAEHVLCLVLVFNELIDGLFLILAGHIL